MLIFELKKLIKSKLLCIIIGLSFILSFYSSFILPDEYVKDRVEENVFNRSFTIITGDAFSDLNNLYQKETMMQKDQYEIKQSIERSEKGTTEYENLLRVYTEAKYEYHKKNHDFVEKFKISYPEILEMNNQEKLENIEWQVFKFGKLLENNASDYYDSIERFGDNSIQQLVNSSSVLFGVIPVLLFILIFSNFISKEREDETLNLLLTQPNKKSKIIISKFFAIIISSLVYIVFTLIFFNIFSLVNGVQIGGLKDIYRVLDSSNHLAYLEGYSLVLRMLFYYFIFINFWSILSMVLSIKYRSTTSLGISLSIFSALYMALNINHIFRTIFNPVYVLNIIDIILGKFELVTTNGITQHVQINSYNPIYLVFYVIGIVLLILVSFGIKDKKRISKKEYKVNNIKNLFGFEKLKILKEKSFLIYIFTFFLLIGVQTINSHFLFNDLHDNYINVDVAEKFDIENMNETEKLLDNYNDEDWLVSHALENPIGKTIEDISENDISLIEAQKDMLRTQINDIKNKIEARKSRVEKFIENDSAKFYKLLSDEFDNNWEIYTFNDNVVGNFLSDKTRKFNRDLFEEASKNEVDSLPVITPFPSIHENYLNLEFKNLTYRNTLIPSSSAFAMPFNLLKTYYLDLIIILVIAMSVFAGFTNDKSGKNHLDLIFSNPISKRRYNLSKVITQFALGLIILSILIIYIMVLGFISEGYVAWNFPIAIYDEAGYSFIYLSSYLLKVVLAIIVALLFLINFMNLLSIFVKYKNTLILLSLFIGIGGYVLSDLIPTSIGRFLPFMYLRVSVLADQSLYLLKEINFVSYEFGLLVLFFWAIVNLLIGNLIIKYKKF
ncbi:MAG: ABC transporter permease [Helcococcus sp.]|nr:ABC transporter permease [Helcococcus sp.]